MDDEADEAGLHATEQARALHAQAEAGGLRFEVYLPPDLATWILDKVAHGVFADPSEAVFAILGEQQEIEPHADLRQEVLRRSLQAAMNDPRPTTPVDEAMQRFRSKLEEPQPEPAVWPLLAIKHTLRQAIDITLPADRLTEAGKPVLNVSQACELGLKAEIAGAQRAQWLEENREAIAFSNKYVEQHGIPLAEFRQF